MKFTFFFIFFFLFFNIEGNSAKAENIKLQGCYNETRTSYDKSGKIKETYENKIDYPNFSIGGKTYIIDTSRLVVFSKSWSSEPYTMSITFMDENEISARGIWSESDDIENFIVVNLKFKTYSLGGFIATVNKVTKFNDNEFDIGRNTDDEKDELYLKALDIVKIEKKASTSFLQRKLQIGYNRAARIIEVMEKEGVVSQANHVGKREIL